MRREPFPTTCTPRELELYAAPPDLRNLLPLLGSPAQFHPTGKGETQGESLAPRNPQHAVFVRDSKPSLEAEIA